MNGKKELKKQVSQMPANELEAAEKLVKENEEASLQDKTYSFDEETTDADYSSEDSLDFYDENREGRTPP